MALRFSLPASVILIACTGGGGGIGGDYQSTQDRAPNSVDGIRASQEAAARTNEAISSSTEGANATGGGTGTGGTGVGAFNCLGTFSCTVSTDVPGAKTASLGSKLHLNGQCNTSEGGFNSDGTITKDGKVLATWHPTPEGGFSYTASTTTSGSGKESPTTYTITVDCTKVSDSPTGDDDDDDGDVQSPPEK